MDRTFAARGLMAPQISVAAGDRSVLAKQKPCHLLLYAAVPAFARDRATLPLVVMLRVNTSRARLSPKTGRSQSGKGSICALKLLDRHCIRERR